MSRFSTFWISTFFTSAAAAGSMELISQHSSAAADMNARRNARRPSFAKFVTMITSIFP